MAEAYGTIGNVVRFGQFMIVMHRIFFVLVFVCGALCLFLGCSRTPESHVVPDTEVPQPEPPPPPKQLPPPGNPGPVLLQIATLFPLQIFGTAATPNYFAIATQGDAYDEKLCPLTNRPNCYKGTAYIAPRMNPNEPKLISLYESDTQSGARVEAIAATADRFFFAVTEGLYAGDTRSTTLIVADQTGNVERTLAMNPPRQIVYQMALASSETNVTSCMITNSHEIAVDDAHIRCEQVDAAYGTRTTVLDWAFETPPRSLDIALLKNDLLIAWTAGGRLYAAFSDAPEAVMEFGEAISAGPYLAVGHEQFMLAWLDDKAQTRITRIVRGEPPSKQLLLNGIMERTLDGLVATVPGFLLSFRYDNSQQLALIEPDLSAWHLVEGKAPWLQLSDYAALDIANAHQGKIVWQTADSLIGEN